MIFPLSFDDLSLFFAVVALILLVTAGLIPTGKEKMKVLINVSNLKKTAIIVSILFMLTIALRLFGFTQLS